MMTTPFKRRSSPPSIRIGDVAFPEIPEFVTETLGLWGARGARRDYVDRHRWVSEHVPSRRTRLLMLCCFARRSLPVFEEVAGVDARPREALAVAERFAALADPSPEERRHLVGALDQAFRAADEMHESAYVGYDDDGVASAFGNLFDRRMRAGMAAYAAASIDAYWVDGPPTGSSSSWADDSALAAPDPEAERHAQSRLVTLFLPCAWPSELVTRRTKVLAKRLLEGENVRGQLLEALESAGGADRVEVRLLRHQPHAVVPGMTFLDRLVTDPCST
jgi:hypothetical protein